MKKTLLSILTLVLGISVYSQEEVKNKEGKIVILNQDYTWSYKDTIEAPVLDSYNVVDRVLPDSNYQCSYFKNEVDEFSGIEKIILKEDVFTTYTSEELKKYFKSRDYLTCYAYPAKIEGQRVVYWRFKILTKSAYKYYGSITTQAKITFKFTDGETMDLQFGVFDSGDTNYDLDYTIYSSFTIIENDNILDKLKSTPIDKMRVYWSQGYQDYEVTNKNLLINSLPCIK